VIEQRSEINDILCYGRSIAAKNGFGGTKLLSTLALNPRRHNGKPGGIVNAARNPGRLSFSSFSSWIQKRVFDERDLAGAAPDGKS
jgi:hypothetical protein